MKIKYLYLKNFVGIYNGLGLTKLELSLENSDNRIVMLNGRNGSGKTTIQTTLHPFAETIDGRSPIMEGKKGEKIIVIRNGDYDYKIKHYWTPNKKSFSIKSYIEEIDDQGNATELNSNGNVTSFKEIIKEKFDIEESYFKLIRIGSDVTNFIDLGPSQRKKFISNFLPDIEPYLKAYKNITEKWTLLKKRVSLVTDQIQKLDTKEHLEDLKNQLEQQIEELNNELVKGNKLLGSATDKMEEIDPNNDLVINHKRLMSELKDINNKLSKIDARVNINKLKDDLNKSNLLLNSTINSREINNRDYIKMKDDAQTILNEIKDKEIKLDSYISGESLEDCFSMVEEYENEIKDIQEIIEEEFQSIKDIDIEPSTVSSMQKFYLDAVNSINKLKSNYTDDVIDTVINKYDKITNEYLLKQEENNRIINNNLYKAKLNLSNLIDRKHYSDILSKRPSGCKFDSCDFIKDALKYSDIENRIAKAESELDEVEKEYSISEKKLNKIRKYIECKKEINSIFKAIGFREEFAKLPELVRYSNFEDFLSSLNKPIGSLTILEDVMEVCQLKNRHKYILENAMPNIKIKMDILKDKDELIKSLKSSISELKSKYSDKEKSLTMLKSIISKSDEDIELYKKGIENLKSAIELREKYDSLVEIKNNLEANIQDHDNRIKSKEELKEKIVRVEAFIKNKESLLKPKMDDLDKVKYKLNKLYELIESKKLLEEKYGKIEAIREALSPTKGIPVLFTNAYLVPIKRITNELLDKAYNGSFFINDFIVTDKDFFIEVQKEDGIIVKDICDASQGEKALTTIAISLALLERSMSKYNILLFDEIDATLDVNNRQAFLNILEDQLDKLSVEQTFVISHNNSFDTASVDLILLKGSNVDVNDKNFMSNKKILLQFK